MTRANEMTSAAKLRRACALLAMTAGLVFGVTATPALAEVNGVPAPGDGDCGPGETIYWYAMPNGSLASARCDGFRDLSGRVEERDAVAADISKSGMSIDEAEARTLERDSR